MATIRRKIIFLWWGYRIIYATAFLGSGLDKFLYTFIDWHKHYYALSFLPVEEVTFFKMRGIIEIMIGIMLMSRFVSTGALLACICLLLSAGYSIFVPNAVDTACRYLVIAWGAWTLQELTVIKIEVENKERYERIKNDL